MIGMLVGLIVGAIAFGVCVLFFLYGISLLLHAVREARKRDWDGFCLCLVLGLIIMGSSGVFAWLTTIILLRLG